MTIYFNRVDDVEEGANGNDRPDSPVLGAEGGAIPKQRLSQVVDHDCDFFDNESYIDM
jgi:hypothetical protein